MNKNVKTEAVLTYSTKIRDYKEDVKTTGVLTYFLSGFSLIKFARNPTYFLTHNE